MTPKHGDAFPPRPRRHFALKETSGARFLISFVIAVVTFAVYTPALRNGFVWDDIQYVWQNSFLHSINKEFFRFAFLGFHFSNWHPLAWISHAVDYSIWGLDPFGHHLTNIVLHSLNSFIVSLLVMRLLRVSSERAKNKGFPERARALNNRYVLMAGAVTGLLFALHPLHVESVAWVAERKDLLCAFFFLLSIRAYTGYRSVLDGETTRTSLLHAFCDREYLLVTGLFVSALMSKPMAVSLPFVLLILDWYPFRRIRSLRTFGIALFEKLPLFGLSLLSAIVTILAQKAGGAMSLVKPLSVRLLVAARGVVFYLWKMVLPLNLVPFYRYPEKVSFLSPEYLSLTVLLVGITLFCVFAARRRKIFLSAWGYYVVTLMPVLGVVQVGMQSMADRYTYLPSIGPFLVCGIAAATIYEKWFSSWRGLMSGKILVFFLAAIMIFLSCLTVRQIGVWRNGVVFWKYVIEQEGGKIYTAHNNLGYAYESEGMFDNAIEQYELALRLYPGYAEAHNNLGVAYQEKGHYEKAMKEYKTALRLKPDYAEAHANLGNMYRLKGSATEAVKEYLEALALNPYDEKTHTNLGNMYLSRGLFAMAIRHYRAALRLKSDDATAHFNLGQAYLEKGEPGPARREFEAALRSKPDYVKARKALNALESTTITTEIPKH